MALFLTFSLYGVYGMIIDRTQPIHLAVVLLISAVAFVISYEYFSSRFVRGTTAVVVAFLVTLCLTIFITALAKFVYMAYYGVVTGIGWETFTIAFAISLIASVLILKYFENF